MGFNARQCNAARGAGSLEAAVETALALDESNVPAATSWHTQGVTEPPATEAQAASLSTESPPSESPEPTVSGRAPNPWNEFQHRMRGTRMTRKEAARRYKLERSGQGSCRP